jgi:hypothetical protein
MSQGKAITYSEEELAYIQRNCRLPRAELWSNFCKIFNRTDVGFVNFKALCTRKGWKTGRTGCFEKGITSHNKGKKMAYNANSARTQFKKGQMPHNTHYIGHERISKDGYIEVCIDEKNPHTGFKWRYQLKHRYLWEKVNGKVPEGMCLKCKDGNRQNTDPSNWEAIPRGMLPFMNGSKHEYNYDHMPEELKPAVLVLAKVKYMKGKVKKDKNNGSARRTQ